MPPRTIVTTKLTASTRTEVSAAGARVDIVVTDKTVLTTMSVTTTPMTVTVTRSASTLPGPSGVNVRSVSMKQAAGTCQDVDECDNYSHTCHAKATALTV